MIFFDYASHTPADKRVLDEFSKASFFLGNPNSRHTEGKKIAQLIETKKAGLATLLNIESDEIIFTSGATESNNTAIKGIFRSSRHLGRHILVSPLEHPSVNSVLSFLQTQGAEIETLKVSSNGMIDTEDLKNKIRPDTIMLITCAVDGETGSVQNFKELKSAIKNYPSCRIHCDATQAIGKIPFDFSYADTAAFAPHKYFGLCGIGVLYKKKNIVIEPLINGGEGSLRGGTPSVALILSLVKATELAILEMEERLQKVKEINIFLRENLEKMQGIIINSPICAVPHIINFSTDGIKGIEVFKALDAKGICVSIKSACSLPELPSAAVYAITSDKKRAANSLRISISHQNTLGEAEEFIKIMKDCLTEIKNEGN